MDLQVDAARNEIYLANGNQILRARLPEPVSTTGPDPAATVTATP
jgi:hypothetical protein